MTCIYVLFQFTLCSSLGAIRGKGVGGLDGGGGGGRGGGLTSGLFYYAKTQ